MGGELTRLSLDFVEDTLRGWLAVQEEAERLHGSLPPDWKHDVETTAGDWNAAVPILALRLHPDERRLNMAVLHECIAVVESLSHPSAILQAERPSEGTMNEEDLDKRITEMERQTAELEAVADRITAALARVERALDLTGR